MIQLYRDGKASAFDEIYRRYSKRLLYFSYRMVGHDESKAQDILQEVFLKLADQPYLFDTSKQFKPWIFTVVANTCRKTFREAESIELADHHFEAPQQHSALEAQIDAKQFKRVLRVALNELKPIHRAVFVLRFQEQLSVKEISEVLAINEGTVKSRIHHATKQLTEKLEVFNPINQD